MTILQLSNGNSDGTVLGQDASDLVALHGSSPVAQAAAISTLVVTIVAVDTTNAGFQTVTQGNNLVTAVNSILTALRNKGIIAA